MEIGMVQKLRSDVKETVNAHKMFEGVDRAIIAFSSGPDSVCLLDILQSHFGKKMEFELVYINHGLRQKSILEREEHLVKKYGRRYGLHVAILRVKIKKQKEGLEAAARKERYRALGEYMKRTRAQRVVLGHNLDDVVETFLLNIVRGSGMRGFRSIPAVRLPYVRPLIDSRKADIVLYLKARKLAYSIDRTNQLLDYRRNFIRLKALPILKKMNPEIHEAIRREIQILIQDDDYLWERAAKVYSRVVRYERDCVLLDLRRLMRYNVSLVSRVVMKAIQNLRGNLDGYESKHYNAIINLMYKGKGKRVTLPKGLYAAKEYDSIVIGYKRTRSDFDVMLDAIPGEIIVSEYRLRFRVLRECNFRKLGKMSEVFDLDALQLPLHVRNRRYGDVIETNVGKKKVKKIFSEKRITTRARESVLIFCDQRGILWIPGIARALRGFVGEETKNFLVVEFGRIDQRS
jgi:tRNA(Ile)-lysidine synthase